MRKIIAGGQTGVDRGALDAALDRGFPCGGWCPAGRRAEDGRIPERFPLTETGNDSYLDRTVRNVAHSDGTLVLGFGALHGGSLETMRACHESARPVLLIDGIERTPAQAATEARNWIGSRGIEVLNVAGPRLSDRPEAYDYAYAVIGELLRDRS